jgi:hypothetical protein
MAVADPAAALWNPYVADSDVKCVLVLAGFSVLFAVFFGWAALRDATSVSTLESAASKCAAKEVGVPSVPPSISFRKSISEWNGFSGAQQVEALDNFRSRLASTALSMPDDLSCLRFLRARQLHVEKALAMYVAHREWHQANVAGRAMGTDVTTETDAILSTSYPSKMIGRDPKGRPVKFIDVGQLDMASLRRDGITDNHVLDYHIREMEMMMRCLCLRDESTSQVMDTWTGPDAHPSLQATDPILGIVAIMDTHGCTMRKFYSALTVWKTMASIDQNNYPEVMGHSLLVRPPRLLRMAFNIMKPFLEERTFSKFEIVDGDPFDRIAELVGHDCVPRLYRADSLQDAFANKSPQASLADSPRKARSETRSCTPWGRCLPPLGSLMGHQDS